MEKNDRIKFIQFGSFILKLSEISYFIKEGEDKIICQLDKNVSVNKFTMDFGSNWARDDAFCKLTIDCEAWNIGYDWKHPLVNQIFILRNYMNNVEEEIKKFRIEFSKARKKLKIKDEK